MKNDHRTKNVIMRRQLHVLATVAALTLGVADAGSAQERPAARGCPTAEIFATDNTAIITDPADSRLNTRLTLFDQEVRKIIHAHGARSGSSTLLDGVFWSGDLKKATYERSREFDVDQVGRDGLHHIADVVAKQYHQESVLTFRCLPRTSTDTDAVEIQAPASAGPVCMTRCSRTRRPATGSAAARSPWTGGSSSSPRSPTCRWPRGSRPNSASTGTEPRCATGTRSS